jgi:adenosylcobinamide kinase / adenosylcobinamide-phosphate guanylyltransferase
MSSTFTLILGGARSGKSKRAENLVAQLNLPVVYVATYATNHPDPEMTDRIDKHRAQRPTHWTTVENQFDLETIFRFHKGTAVLIDCLTLWLSFHCEHKNENELLSLLESALASARENHISLFIVSNELGMGLVPTTPLGRCFRDLCGRANQLVAAHSDHVEFQIAGLPLILKGGPSR